MRYTILTVFLILAAAVAFAVPTDLSTESAEVQYTVRMGIVSAALTHVPADTTDETTWTSEEKLAMKLLKDQPQVWRYLAALLQANQTNAEVNWSALSHAQVKTTANTNWALMASIVTP